MKVQKFRNAQSLLDVKMTSGCDDAFAPVCPHLYAPMVS
jgi:hypothetical protein